MYKSGQIIPGASRAQYPDAPFAPIDGKPDNNVHSSIINLTATPFPPTGLTATDGSFTDRIRVTWNLPSGATGYDVWRNTSDNSSGANRIASDVTGTSYDDFNVLTGTTYWYWTTAENSSGTSAFSNSDSGYRKLATPTNVQSSDGTYTDKVRITWNSVSGADRYEVWRGFSISDRQSIATVFGGTIHDDEEVVPGTSYQYWVRAGKSLAGTVAYGDFSALDTGYARSMPVVTSVTISGPTQVNEKSVANYTAVATYSNGNSQDVTDQATWTENSSFAGIDSSGRLTTSTVSSNQSVRIAASLASRSDTHNVTIEDLPADDNYEENDTAAQAALKSAEWEAKTSKQDGTRIDSLRDVNGLGIQVDEDWYAINVKQGQERLAVGLYPESTGFIDLELYNTQLARVDGVRPSESGLVIDRIVPSAGRYYLRVHGDNSGIVYDVGWEDAPLPRLDVSVNTDSIRGGGTARVTVTRDNDGAGFHKEMVVSLSSTDPQRLSVPSSVTIPALNDSASLEVTATHDSAIDGNATVTISATASFAGVDGVPYTGVGGEATIEIVDDESANLPPMISGTQADRSVDDDATLMPFGNVTITDADGDTLTVIVSLSNSANGTLTNLSGFSNEGGGTYEFVGLASDVTTAIRGLTFDPTENQVAPGQTVTTVFTITTNDAVNPAVTNDATSVIATSVNDPPAVANPIQDQSATVDQAFSVTFAEDTFSDPDGDPLTYAATLSDGSSLPGWLSFSTDARTFSGRPSQGDAGTVFVRVTATDPSGASNSTSFSVWVIDEPTQVTVSVPDFARGPGQPVNVPAATGTGIPLSISDGTGVEHVLVELHYDPALLEITDATVGPDTPTGSTVVANLETPGVATLSFIATTPLDSGPANFVTLEATVPESAPYTSKQTLDIVDVEVNGGGIAAADDDGIHLVAYLGDASGDGMYEGLDALKILKHEVGLLDEFPAYPGSNPAIIGDVMGDGKADGLDAVRVLQETVGMDRPEIPPLPDPLPDPLPLTSPGPDPKVFMPTDLTGEPGDAVTVPVFFKRLPEEADTDFQLVSLGLRVRYLSELLTIKNEDVKHGTISSGWLFVPNV